MTTSNKNWSKTELKIYLLLLCAEADSSQTDEEIELIKKKTDNKTFTAIYEEFKKDDTDTGIFKIERSVHQHEFSHLELVALKKEIHELFRSDKKFSAAEKYLDRILDNIVY